MSLPLGASAAAPLDEIWKIECLDGVPDELEDNEKEGKYNEFRKELYLLHRLRISFYRRISKLDARWSSFRLHRARVGVKTRPHLALS